MRRDRSSLLGLALVVALSACNRPPASDPGGNGPAAVPAGSGDQAVGDRGRPDVAAAGEVDATSADMAAGVLDKEGKPVPLVAFDRDSVPVGQGTLGPLPVVSLPRGYTTSEDARRLAHARFPFRVDDGLHWVEGPAWSGRIGVDDEAAPDKSYSPLEVRRNLEAALEQAGAKRVHDGPHARDLYYGSLQEEIGDGFIDVVNHSDASTQVYVIRRADRTVWIQLVFAGATTGMVAVDEKPFEATSRWSDAFPYVSLPSNYDHRNKPLQRDFDAFPFWTGTAFEEVEGRAYAIDFDAGEDTSSMHEVRRNLEAMMQDAGGVLVHAGPVPAARSESIGFDRKSPYSHAAGFSWDEGERSTWRVDLGGGRQVWIHARLDPRTAGWVVVERERLEQTSALLAADAMKQQIDAGGRVAIQVNFAVDKSEILADSQPQLDQVVALLRTDPSLRLSVDGHTDGSGDAGRNRELSVSRAQSVVAALAAAGIGADRLQARGYGADRPVADNTNDAGKAQNRRVELVKL